MSTNYIKKFIAVTAAVLLASVPVSSFAVGAVRYESGVIEWVDVQRGELGLSRATPDGILTTAYRITENNTRVTNPIDTKYLNIADLWAGEEVSIEVIDGQEGEIVQKIIIGSSSAYNSYKQQQVDLSEAKARDLASGKLVSLVGPRGPAGSAGADGERGFIGAEGAPGVVLKGARGQQGPAGPVGEQGLTGPRGASGYLARGSSGEAGAAGMKGQQGDTGKMGSQGDSLAGYAGPQGAVGSQGERGQTGKAGARGTTLYGPSGPAGAAGAAGKQGIAGAQGPQGSSAAGIAGLAGAAGAQGVQGKMGAAGEQGFAGQVDQWVFYKEFNFSSDATRLNEEDKQMVVEIANYTKKNPSLQIGIDGTAIRKRDQALNNRRVNAIRAALIEAGMSSDKIIVGEIGDETLRRKGQIQVLFATAKEFLSKN